jgi:PAS domain S-box-containing protein
MSADAPLWLYNIAPDTARDLAKILPCQVCKERSALSRTEGLILVGAEEGSYPAAATFLDHGLTPVALVRDFKARKRALQEGFVHQLEEEAIADAEYIRQYLGQLRPESAATRWHSPALKEAYFDIMGTATLVTDPQGIVRLWNTEAENLLGYSAREAIGFSLQFLGVFAIPGHEYAEGESTKEDKFLSHVLPFGEYLARRKDGSIFPVELRMRTLYTPAGETRAYVATIHDIEGYKNEEKQIRLQSFRNQKLLESNKEAIMITDTKGRIQFVSDSVYFYTGYSHQELEKWNAFDLVHPDDQPKLKERLTLLRNGQKSVQSKHRAFFRNGEYRWVQATISDERGTPGIDGIVSTFKDVHKKEEALAQLQEVNERFRYASFATQDVIWEYRVKEDELIWGDNFDLIFGLGQETSLILAEWEARIHPESREQVAKTFQALLEGGQETWQEEYRFLKSNGEYSVVKDRGYVLFDAQKKPHRIVGAMQDISRQRHFQNELAKSEEKFRKLFEKSLLGVTMTDLETGQWLDANQALINMLGYPFEELTQLTSRAITPEAYYKVDQENRAIMKETGSYGPYQKELIRKDQNRINVVLSGFSATLPSGRSVAWHHILDLSPIEKSYQALQKVQMRFQHYVENASDVFIVLSGEGQYEYVSPNIQSLLGYTADEVIHQHNLDFIHPEDQELVDGVFQKALADIGSSHRSHFRGLHKEGHHVWVEANGRFIYDPEGQLQAHLLVRKMPISREQQARESLLALVADKTTNAVIITDAAQRIEWVNHSFTQFSGYSLQEARGYTPTELLHREKDESEQAAIQEKLRKGAPFYQESVNYHKDGTPYWIESYVTPIHDEEGQLSHYIAVENNITERRQNWQQLQQSLEKSRLQSERLENFAHIISHNFRAHCANIMGLAEELPYHQAGESRREMEESLRHTAQLLMDALQKLGDILHLPEGDQLSMETLSLAEGVQEVVRQFSFQKAGLKAQIETAISPRLQVQASPAYLESVVHNLVSNALRYRHPQRPPHIQITAQEDGEEIRLLVQDNGLGIDLEKHGNKLFQMHQSFHDHPESKGLGLYLAQGQMRAMGGHISVKSKKDQGTTFTLHFPKKISP